MRIIIEQGGDGKEKLVRDSWLERFRVEIHKHSLDTFKKHMKGFVRTRRLNDKKISVYWIWPLAPFAMAYNRLKFAWYWMPTKLFFKGYLKARLGDVIPWYWPVLIRFKKRSIR